MEKRRKWHITCHECGKDFMAKKSNALYCTNACKQRSYQRNCRIRKIREKEGPIKINPYFLIRGDIYKNLSNGQSMLNGAA